MNLLHKLDALVVKAKAEWRRTLTDAGATVEGRQRARTSWKNAVARKDRAMAIWLQARANRRKLESDRRRASDPDWQERNADRRKAERAQGRRLD